MKKVSKKSFNAGIIELVESGAPELKDKIQMVAVDEKTTTPYAAISVPEDEPIYTCNGIAGSKTIIEITVCDTSLSRIDLLKEKIIESLNFKDISQRRCYFISSEIAYYSEQNVHGHTITFKII